MTSPIPSIVNELCERQKTLGLTDDKFAKRLQLSRTLWMMTRNGHRRVNVTLLRGVAGSFPDMDDQILEFLRK